MVYEKISKLGWTCVAGHLGILCHRDKAPLEAVDFFSENSIKIVDSTGCTTTTTPANRVHTVCEFKKRDRSED